MLASQVALVEVANEEGTCKFPSIKKPTKRLIKVATSLPRRRMNTASAITGKQTLLLLRMINVLPHCHLRRRCREVTSVTSNWNWFIAFGHLAAAQSLINHESLWNSRGKWFVLLEGETSNWKSREERLGAVYQLGKSELQLWKIDSEWFN